MSGTFGDSMQSCFRSHEKFHVEQGQEVKLCFSLDPCDFPSQAGPDIMTNLPSYSGRCWLYAHGRSYIGLNYKNDHPPITPSLSLCGCLNTLWVVDVGFAVQIFIDADWSALPQRMCIHSDCNQRHIKQTHRTPLAFQ